MQGPKTKIIAKTPRNRPFLAGGRFILDLFSKKYGFKKTKKHPERVRFSYCGGAAGYRPRVQKVT